MKKKVKRVRKEKPLFNAHPEKWRNFHLWEALWSPTLGKLVRFLGVDQQGNTQVATMDGIAPLDQTVPYAELQRPSVMENPPESWK